MSVHGSQPAVAHECLPIQLPKKSATADALDVARARETAMKKGRIAALETQIEIKKEDREKVRADRDAVKKLIDQGVVGGLDIEGMRKAIEPNKEMLAKLNALLAGLRFE